MTEFPVVRDISGPQVVRRLAVEHGLDLSWEAPLGEPCSVRVQPSLPETAAAVAVCCAAGGALRAEEAGAGWVVRSVGRATLDAPRVGEPPRSVPVEELRTLLQGMLRDAGIDGIVAAVQATDWTIRPPTDSRTLRDLLAGSTPTPTDPWREVLAEQGINVPPADARIVWRVLEGSRPVLFVDVVDRSRDIPVTRPVIRQGAPSPTTVEEVRDAVRELVAADDAATAADRARVEATLRWAEEVEGHRQTLSTCELDPRCGPCPEP